MDDVSLEHVDVNIYYTIQLMVEEQKQLLTNKKITVVNEIDKHIEWKAEPEMLKIIFRNLLNNAIKFTDENGRISFTYLQDGRYGYVCVKDNGEGISEATIDKLNAREYNSTNGTANELGSGLGLLLTKDLIERHHGELIIESGSTGGSTFTVKIPLSPN